MRRRLWKIKELTPQAKRLAAAGNISLPFAQVLTNRNIGEDDLAYFLNPALDNLHSAHSLPDMDKAARRIQEAVRSGEKILIAGDYDVDGITALAIFHEFIRDFAGTFSFYIPHRVNDGYGLNKEAVKQAAASGATLLVAFDCGTNSQEEVELARSHNIDVIVIDHHHPQPGNFTPFAFVNAKRSDSNYPFADLPAGALAFKLLQVLTNKPCWEVLDLVALSIVCDVAPLQGENRILLKEGLERIRNSQRPSIKALCRISRARQENLSSFHLGYILGPRINASGRVAHAHDALQLFLTNSHQEAYHIASQLTNYNQLRKGIEADILKEAEASLTTAGDDYAIVAAGSGWHPGVLGIVASRLCDKYYRPAFVISFQEESGKGSGRSIEGIHLMETLAECADFLTDYGGHQKAAGIRLSRDNLAPFKERINSCLKDNTSPQELVPTLAIDAKLDFSDIDMRLVRELESLLPFGEGNGRPLFAAPAVSKKTSLKKIKSGYSVWLEAQNATYEALVYDRNILEILDYADSFAIAYSLDRNTYHDIPRLVIRDLRLKEG